MKKRALKPKMSYESDADVFRVELQRGIIDYAKEVGPFIVHFSRTNVPLYIEILQARSFFSQSEKIVSKTSVAHYAS